MLRDLNIRHVFILMALAAFCAVAVPASGALPPSEERENQLMSDVEHEIMSEMRRIGLQEPRIVGVYSFFVCSHGCADGEDVIQVEGRHPEDGRQIDLWICHNRSTDRFYRPRPPIRSTCTYESAPESAGEFQAPPTMGDAQ
ncbi:MAG: hypothetical protein U9Q03_01105 [Patescibacteria group bacterium]|nr:hypothetical protein [Patescibacteria group bacterium]